MGVATAVGTLAVGAVFGLALAAPPGPMNAVIAEESVVRGWLAGFTAGLGAMTADLVFFVLAVAGAVTVVDRAPTLRAGLFAVGGVVMLYFAFGAVREARASSGEAVGFGGGTGAASETVPGSARDVAASRGFRKALVLALTNPYQILFWLTVGVGLLRPGTVDVLSHLPAVGTELAGTLVVETGSPALLAGLFCGIVVWIVGFPALLVWVGRRIDRFAPAVAALSAVVLAGFGVTFCWTAVTMLLG